MYVDNAALQMADHGGSKVETEKLKTLFLWQIDYLNCWQIGNKYDYIFVLSFRVSRIISGEYLDIPAAVSYPMLSISVTTVTIYHLCHCYVTTERHGAPHPHPHPPNSVHATFLLSQTDRSLLCPSWCTNNIHIYHVCVFPGNGISTRTHVHLWWWLYSHRPLHPCLVLRSEVIRG